MEIEIIKSRTRQELFTFLYEQAFPKVASFVNKSGGSFEDAKDIFQDALIAFYEKKTLEDTAEVADELSYIIGISKFLWYKKFRDDKPITTLDEATLSKLTEEREAQVSERLLRFVESSGKKCLELLKGFYYDKHSMQELAAEFDFSGERSATVQKYKCLEKVREAIKRYSLNKEDFYE